MASQSHGLDPLLGLELGHYRVVEKIGAGGMGRFTAPMMVTSTAK